MDHRLTLKPVSDWPQVNPRARIDARRTERYRVCGELFNRGIIAPIALSDVFHANGCPVLSGAFAVEKRGRAGVGQCRVTRLIMHLVPCHAFQRLPQGDLNTLSSSTAWSQLVLKEKQVRSVYGVMIKKEPFMHGSFHNPGAPSCASLGLCQDILWALSMTLSTWRRASSLWA